MKDQTYTLLLDEKHTGMLTGRFKISKEGADIIWAAYISMWGGSQTLDQRENRGGFMWLSEVKGFIESKYLDKDFDYKQYEVK